VSRPAAPPAPSWPGIDPGWSRRVVAPDAGGTPRTWHLLDNGTEPEHGTLLCVHGNPTWSYLWRRVIAAAPPGWRVVAVDQLGMGWSERTDPRTLAERVDDLTNLTQLLGITGPVVTSPTTGEAPCHWGGRSRTGSS